MFSVSKIPLDKNGNPTNSEGLDQKTNNTRNSVFIRRAEGEPIAPGGGGWAISKFDVTSNENTLSMFKDRVNGKFKIKTMIVATGTEQVALDCEKFIQQSHEHRPGKMWSNTRGGERIGIREGNYCTDVTIPRIQSAIGTKGGTVGVEACGITAARAAEKVKKKEYMT